MEYLQYCKKNIDKNKYLFSFKPYYKWNTFNTFIPIFIHFTNWSFKPYYKWNTFNTNVEFIIKGDYSNGFKPYYKWNTFNTTWEESEPHNTGKVLNLIINGIPSIHKRWL